MHIEESRLARLYEYWLECKGDRRFPMRRDLDPVAIRFVLGHVMLVDVLRDPLRFRVRLHGSEMARLAQYDLTGKFLNDLPSAEYRDYVIGQCAGLVESGEPLLVHHNRILDNRPRAYEALWLPFSEDGHNVTMLLCGLIYDRSPRTAPPPLEASDRYLTPASAPAKPAAPVYVADANPRQGQKLGWSSLLAGWPKMLWAR